MLTRVALAGLAAGLLLVGWVAPGSAQVVDGAVVRGVVTDEVGMAVEGASVTFRSASDGRVFRATTDADGHFQIPAIVPGRYDVRVERLGYQIARIDAVQVDATGAVVDVEVQSTPVALEAVEVVGRRGSGYKSDYSFAATKVAMPLPEIPQSISAVTKELLADQEVLRIDEATQNVAGLNAFSTYDDLVIRGFRTWSGRLMNGLRLSGGWYHQTLFNVERIEVVKGPASALFSNVIPGGTVNYVTKKPLAEERRSVRVTLGSWNTSRAAVDFTGPLNEDRSLLYRLNVGYENAESFRSRMFNRTLFAAPTLTFLPDDRTAINAELIYSRNESVLDRGQPSTADAESPNTPIDLMVSQPGDFLNTTRTHVNVSLTRTLADGLSANLSYLNSRHDEELREHRIRGFATNEVIILGFYDREQGEITHNFTGYLSYDLQTGGLSHAFLAGVDYIKSNTYSTQVYSDSVGTFDLMNPVWTRRPVSSYTLETQPLGAYDGYYNTLGFYLQDRVDVGPLSVLASVRREVFTTEDRTAYVTEDVSTDAWIPRLGATYRLSEAVNLYGTYTTGFQPADAWLQSPTYGGPFTKPETSEMFEVGTKAELFGDRLFATLALYDIEKNDVIIWANDSDDPNLYRQRGQERSRGAELEVVGAITDGLSITLNAAYNRTEVTEDVVEENIGKIKENAPEWTSGLWASYKSPAGLGFAVGYDYVGERNTFDEGFTLPSYRVWKGALQFELDRFRTSVTVRNLTDEVHWTGGYYPGRVFPGEPRRILVSVDYVF